MRSVERAEQDVVTPALEGLAVKEGGWDKSTIMASDCLGGFNMVLGSHGGKSGKASLRR